MCSYELPSRIDCSEPLSPPASCAPQPPTKKVVERRVLLEGMKEPQIFGRHGELYAPGVLRRLAGLEPGEVDSVDRRDRYSGDLWHKKASLVFRDRALADAYAASESLLREVVLAADFRHASSQRAGPPLGSTRHSSLSTG